MDKNNQIVSIDIGNGYIKAINEQGESLHFPSIITKEPHNNLYDPAEDDEYIRIGGIGYYFGALAGSNGGIREWHDEHEYHHSTPEYVAYCAHMLSAREKISVDISLGLPLEVYQHTQKGKNLVKELKEKEFATVNKKGSKTIRIHEVSVYPQGMGAYFSNMYNLHGKRVSEKTAEAIFIDVGYRTTDIIAYANINGRPVPKMQHCFSLLNSGMERAYQDIRDEIYREKRLKFDIEQLVFAIQNRKSILPNAYGDIDLSKYEPQVYEKLAEELHTQIFRKLSDDINKLYANIILTGGGSDNLYDYLKKHYPNLKKQEDSLMANVKGFLSITKLKQNRVAK